MVMEELLREILDAKIKQTKDRIVSWLKEEGLWLQEEVDDPNAWFNIGAKVVDLKLSIVQAKPSLDSIFLASKWTFSQPQLHMFHERLDAEKKRDFYFDLQFQVLNNNELGELVTGPMPPDDLSEVTIYSRRVYYSELTKERFLQSLFIVRKALVASVFLFEKYTGTSPPMRREGKVPKIG
jgi:hypothetical protein